MPRAHNFKQLAESYSQLARSLAPQIQSFSLYDGDAGLCGSLSGDRDSTQVWLRSLGWSDRGARPHPAARILTAPALAQVAIPLLKSSGALLAGVCIELPPQELVSAGIEPTAQITTRIKPALDCLHRELASIQRKRAQARTLSERTAELEWLFNVTEGSRSESGTANALEQLLVAATGRLECGLGALLIPEREVSLRHVLAGKAGQSLLQTLTQTQTHLLTWAERKRAPLVVRAPIHSATALTPCKLLSVPIFNKTERVIGVLAFFNSTDASSFGERHLFLARHLARQIAQLLEAQFDPMTGLNTRVALEERCDQACEEDPSASRSIVYVDIDGLHVVNEVHGYELGDELIVRIADLLTSSSLPSKTLVGRISGDRFALILHGAEASTALDVARGVQRAAARIVLGPSEAPVHVSLSCGIASLVATPKGFSRGLAAAELACKSAKDHGRGRAELYACDDSSMMRRHDDVIVVGQLREALRCERLLLYAQPIVELARDHEVVGYELLLRMSGTDGNISLPGEFISAAQRYQLLPTIDRYVVRRALETVRPYRNLLRDRGLSLSINVSGQSLSDETFIEFLLQSVKTCGVAPGLLTWEITEQAAVADLSKAAAMMHRLRQAGCRVALDDFGTGSNTLASLKGLPATRLKIDGSFVRDLATNRRSDAMITAMVSLAGQLGMDTVAEYVENRSLAARLLEMGVEYGQGYAFGHPEPLEGLLARMRDDESRRLRTLWLEN